MATITIDQLSRQAVKYQKDIQMLPYSVMLEELAKHGITLFPGVQNEHKIVSFLRKRGVAKPYATDITLNDSDVGKMVESTLKVETAYASIADNVKNYKEVVMVTPDEMLGSNKVKKHPFEVKMMMGVVRTFAEDILDAVFNGERDTADQSPMGLFDGFETKIVDAVTGGEISGGNNNLLDSGVFAAPVDESDFVAYTRLRDWLRAQNPFLLKNAILLLPQTVARYCMDALKNKTKQKAATIIDFQEYLNEDVDSNIKIVKSRLMGTGSRIYLTAPGNMDFGMNTLGDETFFEVNRLDKDRNKINYWLQGEYGTRWRNFHEKVFATNTGTLTANRMSGDYVS